MRRQVPRVNVALSTARANLATILMNATPERFERFSVESLSRINRTPKAEIREALLAETMRRRR